jgi:hypothetical protein
MVENVYRCSLVGLKKTEDTGKNTEFSVKGNVLASDKFEAFVQAEYGMYHSHQVLASIICMDIIL